MQQNKEGTASGKNKKPRRNYSVEDKIRIVLEGLKGEISLAELCRREGIHTNYYYNWSKAFLDAGKRRLSGNIQNDTKPTVDFSALKHENEQLKLLVADLSLKNMELNNRLNDMK